MSKAKKEETTAEVKEEQTQPSADSKDGKKGKRAVKVFLAFVVLFLVWWFNNLTLRTTHFTVYSDEITESVRIAVISDLHASEYGISNERIIKRIENASPDAVFILGDMYSRDSEWELMEIPVKLVEELVQKGYAVYFVPGEHDTSQLYIDSVSNAGAKVMDYKSEIVNIKGNSIEILGIDNVYFSPTFDLNNAFTLTEGCYSILMAHIPNYQAYASFGADLTICGDTHGGIIQLPFDKGPAYYSETDEWFPEFSGARADVFDKGMFPYNGGVMFITSGIGNYPVPARFGNRPEVAVIDIKSSEKE